MLSQIQYSISENWYFLSQEDLLVALSVGKDLAWAVSSV